MQSTAAKFEQGNQSLQSMLTNLMGQLEGLQSAWQGLAGKSFSEVKQAYSAEQQKIQDALLQTAEAIRTSGKTYTTTDESAASRVSATNRGVSLPL